MKLENQEPSTVSKTKKQSSKKKEVLAEVDENIEEEIIDKISKLTVESPSKFIINIKHLILSLQKRKGSNFRRHH